MEKKCSSSFCCSLKQICYSQTYQNSLVNMFFSPPVRINFSNYRIEQRVFVNILFKVLYIILEIGVSFFEMHFVFIFACSGYLVFFRQGVFSRLLNYTMNGTLLRIFFFSINCLQYELILSCLGGFFVVCVYGFHWLLNEILLSVFLSLQICTS